MTRLRMLMITIGIVALLCGGLGCKSKATHNAGGTTGATTGTVTNTINGQTTTEQIPVPVPPADGASFNSSLRDEGKAPPKLQPDPK